MEQANNNANTPNQASEVKPPKKNRRRLVVIIIIILLLLLGLYFLFRMFLPKPNNYGNQIDVNKPAGNFDIGQSDLSATSTAAARSKAIAWSENFDMMQINLEGSGTNVFDLAENEILTLSNIKSEIYMTKQGERNEIRALVSCQTNKRSYVEVEYYKSGEKNKRVIKDAFFGFSHTIVVPDLDPNSVYRYLIRATDSNQAQANSGQFVFYSGAGSISLVDILGEAVEKVFGWAIGR